MIKKQKSGINIIVFFIAIVFVGIVGWIYFQPSTNNQKNQSAQLTPTPVFAIPNNWKTLSNLNHIFMYPPEAKADAREAESLVFYMGQKQIDSGRTQTELFDGYSFRTGIIDAKSDMTLEQVAKNERDNARENCQSEKGQVSQLKSIVIDGYVGFQYFARECYIDYTETIVSFEDKIYRISQSYVGDTKDQEKYKEITDQILSSLKFTK